MSSNEPVLASVTRLRVRLLRYMPGFFWYAFRSQQQAMRAPGFVGGALLIDSHRTFWTLTVWENEKAMKVFRGSGAHARVMPRLAKWCDEAAYAHWIVPVASGVPSWPEAYERLTSEGKLSRVEKPSNDHLSRKFPSPRLKPLIGQELRPRRPLQTHS